jgi:uncharacterized protein YjbI with pentapeptide repeats
MNQASYFSIRLREEHPYDYMQRWHVPYGVALRESIIAALTAGQDLPEDIPMLEAEFANGIIKLVDLRGIDLSGLAIGDVDLSYCCFDRANFSGSQFEGTHLQYSSMNDAKFNSVKWDRVQASPISACGASFNEATIQSSFLMHSDLEGANFYNAILRQTPFVGCMLGRAKLSAAAQHVQIDITQAILLDEEELQRLAVLSNLIGLPYSGGFKDDNKKKPVVNNDSPITLHDAEKLAREIVNAWVMREIVNSRVGIAASAVPLGKAYFGDINCKLIDDVAKAFGVQHYSYEEVNVALGTGIAGKTTKPNKPTILNVRGFIPFLVGLPLFAMMISGTNRELGSALINYMKTRSPYK